MSFPQFNQSSSWDFVNPQPRNVAFNNGLETLRRDYNSRSGGRHFTEDIEPWLTGQGYGPRAGPRTFYTYREYPPPPSEMDPYELDNVYQNQRRDGRPGSVAAPVDYGALGMQPPGQPQMQRAGPPPVDPYDQVDPYGRGMYNLNRHRDLQEARYRPNSVSPPSSAYPSRAWPSEPDYFYMEDLLPPRQNPGHTANDMTNPNFGQFTGTNSNVSQFTGYMNSTNPDGESLDLSQVDSRVTNQRMQDYLAGVGPAMAGGPRIHWADTCSDSGPGRAPGRRVGGAPGGGPPSGGWPFDF